MTLDMCGSLCTDGAPAMLGYKSDFADCVKKEVPYHHSHTLCTNAHAAEILLEQLKNVLSIGVSAINYIRQNA